MPPTRTVKDSSTTLLRVGCKKSNLAGWLSVALVTLASAGYQKPKW
jgi:hypothetical protein